MAWNGIEYWCIKDMLKVYLICCPILIGSKVYQRSARDGQLYVALQQIENYVNTYADTML